MQVSSKLRRYQTGYTHWCPACLESHILPDSWQFDGNLQSPTFTPSFKHSGVQHLTEDEYERVMRGEKIEVRPWCCHYVLTNGVLNFCGDCTHDMKNMSVPLPDLPTHLMDE